MHPELLSNSIFLRYYQLWQQDPTSIVFAPIAEYFLSFGLIDEAVVICQEGLKNNPDCVSGKIALAKAYFRKKDFIRAQDLLHLLLRQIPDHEKALELLEQMEKPKALKKERAGWETVTMAKIYAAQGHIQKARALYQAILQQDPASAEALEGLARLESEV